jgi:hypothetical protein
MLYGITFRTAHITNYFSEVISQTSVEATSVEEAVIQALPSMPHYTAVIQVCWYNSEAHRYRHRWFVFSNGDLREVEVSRLEWQWFIDRIMNPA